MFCRGACSIEMTNKVIITGGYDENSKMGSTRVAVYNNDGFLADWPSLDTGRQDHGCGHFVNKYNNEVMGLICANCYVKFLGVPSGGWNDRRTKSNHFLCFCVRIWT